MGRNMAIAIVDENGRERASHKVTYGAKLLVEDGDKVKRGDRLAEWDPYTLSDPHREATASAKFDDLVEGVSMREDGRRGHRHHPAASSSTGGQSPRGTDLQARDRRHGRRRASRSAANEAATPRYLLSVDAILSVEDGARGRGRRRAGAYPARERQDQGHHRRSAAGGRAVRGAPAEGPRDHRRDRRHGRVRQGLQEQARGSSIEPDDESASRSST